MKPNFQTWKYAHCSTLAVTHDKVSGHYLWKVCLVLQLQQLETWFCCCVVSGELEQQMIPALKISYSLPIKQSCPILFLEIYCPVGFHFNPNWACLVLRIGSSMRSPAVEWAVLCWAGVKARMPTKARHSPHPFCLFLVLRAETPWRRLHFHPATELQRARTTWRTRHHTSP